MSAHLIETRAKRLGINTDPVALVVIFTWSFVPIVIGATVFIGNPVIVAGGLALAFACFGTFGSVFLKTSPWRPVAAALGLIGQAVAMTSAFEGHPWQIDSHMVFYAVLAATVGMGSVRAIVASVVLIALHHAMFSVIMPSLIYPSFDIVENVSRTGFHAVVVVMQASALILAVTSRNRLSAQQLQAAEDLREAIQTSDQAREQALDAQHKAEDAVRRAEVEQKSAQAALLTSQEAQTRQAEAEGALRSEEQKRQSEMEAAVFCTTVSC